MDLHQLNYRAKIKKKARDVLIALIGRRWLVGDADDDYLHSELAAAFKRNIPVFPVLAAGASIPRYDELPDDLKALAHTTAWQISEVNFDDGFTHFARLLSLKLPKISVVQPEIRAGDMGPSPTSPAGDLRPGDMGPPAPSRPRRPSHPGKGGKKGAGAPRPRVPEAAEPSLATILARGNFSKEAVHRAVNVQAEPERSPVDCTVFAPDRVERGRLGLLQAFLHAPEAREEAEAAAKQFDPEATERGYRSLVLDAPIGTTFAFDVEIEGFIFHERTDTLLWTGKAQAATFRFGVPEGCKLGQHAGTVRISQNGAPVGRITFQIEVVLDASDASKRPVGREARHYHACFCSYSSLDRAEMLKRAQGLLATGLETFIDVLNLRPGEKWNPKIFEAIDESDLFVVIWSKNASDSKWVKKETRYALGRYKRQGSPDFRPIPVEGPPIAAVPRVLKAYHFNDELLGQIRAAELEMQSRKRKKSKR